jgi:hypothetical protein
MDAVNKLLKDLDSVARNYCHYEYGLPIEEGTSSEMIEMRNLVSEFYLAKTSNIGKVITDFYCNGWFGRRYDLEGAVIEAEGKDWILVRIKGEELEVARFSGNDNDEAQKDAYIKKWTSGT